MGETTIEMGKEVKCVRKRPRGIFGEALVQSLPE